MSSLLCEVGVFSHSALPEDEAPRVTLMALYIWLPFGHLFLMQKSFYLNRTVWCLWNEALGIVQEEQSKQLWEHAVDFQVLVPMRAVLSPFQHRVWRLWAWKAAQLLHGGASPVHRQHWCCCWRRELQVWGIPKSRSKTSGTATSKSWGPRVTPDASEPTTWPPVPRTARRLWWENSPCFPEL